MAALIPIDHAVHHAMISDRQMLHPVFASSRHVIIDTPHAIEQRKFGVKVQVRELTHGTPLLPCIPESRSAKTSALSMHCTYTGRVQLAYMCAQ